MEKSDIVFIMFQAPFGELLKPDNVVTRYIKDQQVKSILGVQLVQTNPQFGMGNVFFVGLLYERRLPEERPPREPKRESGKSQSFQKRPKPEPLR